MALRVLRNEKKKKGHEPVEVPETTSGSSQEVWVSARGNAVDSVISAHDATGSAFFYAFLERWLVRLRHVSQTHLFVLFIRSKNHKVINLINMELRKK